MYTSTEAPTGLRGISLTVSDWCGLSCLSPSWGWAQLCDTGRDRGEGRAAADCAGQSCPGTRWWPGAGRWSTAACWRSRWPAGCRGWLWSALCCSHGNSSSLGHERGRRKEIELKKGWGGKKRFWLMGVVWPVLDMLPLSFPPVKAPLKVPPPAASPSGISSRFNRALVRGCL